MDVFVVDRDLGRWVDLYFVSDYPDGTREVVYPESITENGEIVWRRRDTDPGEEVARPTMTLTARMFKALAEACAPKTLRADEELVRRLRLEEGRVEKLMDVIIGQVDKRKEEAGR